MLPAGRPVVAPIHRHPLAWRSGRRQGEHPAPRHTRLAATDRPPHCRNVLAVRHQSHSASPLPIRTRSEEHTSELQSLMRISYAVFCLKKKKKRKMKEDREIETRKPKKTI